ncbi:MAG: helix-turn-helix domain-containing protein, partial [Candidatus Methanomethylicaceae archaeon]
MYRWYQIKVMHENGKGIKGIARELGVSKNTVRKYLRSSDPPKFKARGYEKKLDRFQREIQEMVGQRYIGTRIYEELRKVGYDGSLSSVYRYLEEFRERERVEGLSTTRVETAPGHQMQYDWKEWDLGVGEGRV